MQPPSAIKTIEIGPLAIEVEQSWVLRATEWALRRVAHTIDRRNMNPRNLAQRIDDAAMGEIASVTVANYLENHGRIVKAYDDIRIDEGREPDSYWDLAVGESVRNWPSLGGDPQSPPDDAVTVSVKSSRIPPRCNEDPERALESCDFKIFRHSADIGADLRSEVEAQVYYRLSTKILPSDVHLTKTDLSPARAEHVADALSLHSRYAQCWLMGFATRRSIWRESIRLARAGEPTTWTSMHEGHEKQMWRAPLKQLARMLPGQTSSK